MSHCLYDELEPPTQVEMIRAHCHRCRWTVPESITGTYTHDEVIEGKLFHIVTMPVLVCPECGHSAERFLRPCKIGNSGPTIEHAHEVIAETIAALALQEEMKP